MKKNNILSKTVKSAVCVTIALSVFAFGAAENKTYAATPKSKNLIASSKNYIGTPYQYGAKTGDTDSFDCSSFTQFMFQSFGVWLPRTSAAQASMGKKVDRGSLSMGDLVFFNTNGRSISHVAIYAGNNQIIHSSSSKGVTISDMNSSYWKGKYVTARRVL
ncbi:C40 family peptidase [Paenibacillus soyae]|uniref:C40 family peptidase n=1 Tax=Paenibacillus soyae TaxID=2969249 RepID=A0A9X2MT42_9BACL|nr:C40 family peptidase [Paenibacillus soyae]MCR2806456.1 C40 family peptidase [Paenibacillus soyae]